MLRFPPGFLPRSIRRSASSWVARPLAANDVARRGCEDLAASTSTCDVEVFRGPITWWVY